MPAQKRDELVKVYTLPKKDWLAFQQVGGPICHYGRDKNDRMIGHHVKENDEWADLKTRPKGNTVHGCLPHMKVNYPEAFEDPQVKQQAEAIAGTVDEANICKDCGADLKDSETVEGFKCQECEYTSSAESMDQHTLRECSNDNCGAKFVATEGNNCPECNRPFTRKLAEVGCEECNEGEMEKVKVRVCPDCDVATEVS